MLCWKNKTKTKWSSLCACPKRKLRKKPQGTPQLARWLLGDIRMVCKVVGQVAVERLTFVVLHDALQGLRITFILATKGDVTSSQSQKSPIHKNQQKSQNITKTYKNTIIYFSYFFHWDNFPVFLAKNGRSDLGKEAQSLEELPVRLSENVQDVAKVLSHRQLLWTPISSTWQRRPQI